MKGGPERLVGLVNILKNYPNVKIKVGAFADKTGKYAANYAISEKRAQTIKATLETAGFPKANLSIEGFGDNYAKAPAEAADALRAPDRDIAMRFTK
jgi:outer membrane protein OmpA-like peptidoglycan-associated protein